MKTKEYVVADEEEVGEGERLIVDVDGKEVAVIRSNGDFYALVNFCPHQGGPACEGALGGTVRASYDRETLELDLQWHKDGEVLSCPWHAWEFDITTGEHLANDGVRLITYPARIEDGKIVVTIR